MNISSIESYQFHMKFKSISFYFFWSILLTTLLSACDEDPIDSPGVSIISYELDGEAISHRAVGTINFFDRLNDIDDSIVVELNRTIPETPFITLFYNSPNTINLLGTFTFDAEETSGIFIEFTGANNLLETFGSSSCPNVSGEITITEQDPEQRILSGTFSGSICDPLGNERIITNGVIENVRYVIQVQEEG